MTIKDRYAIVGLGVTKQGVIPEMNADELSAEAVLLALADAGLRKDEVDGLIYQPPIGGGVTGDVPRYVGLPINFIWAMQSGGATAIATISAAIGAIEQGLATAVVCVHGTNARSQKVLVGGSESRRSTPGAFGLFGPGSSAAFMARRHMHLYGTTSRQLGAVAVAEREYACMRPEAMMHGRPITIEDHQKSRLVVDPLRMLDFCLVTDGAAAVIVTSAERARTLKRPPVYVMGLGMTHSLRDVYHGASGYDGIDFTPAKEKAFGTAGVTIKDIDVAQLYDAFTILVVLQLEGYGFCGIGEGGPFVAAGNTRLTGAIPTNTAGGELSWSYIQGFTHLTEAVRQLRGESGLCQVKDAELCLVTGIGATGTGSAHGAMILRK